MAENKDMLNEAVEFAARAHRGQCRKGSDTPYITHPMEVVSICMSITDDIEVLSAAVLHDVVEDTEATIDDIRERFGERVAGLVAGESENKREDLPPAETWKIRKTETIEHLKNTADPGIPIVCLGDKLSNIRLIQRDIDAIGDRLWDRFNQKDPEEYAWYYRAIGEVLKETLGDTAAWKEYDRRVRAVFGPRGYMGDEPDRVTLLELKRWCDHLLSCGIEPDVKVVVDRSEGLEGYSYANDLHLDDGRYADSTLVLVGAYRHKDDLTVGKTVRE